jgi:hypothetical protein
MKGSDSMKKLLSVLALALFLGAFTVGCSSSSTSGGSSSPSPVVPKTDTPPKTGM